MANGKIEVPFTKLFSNTDGESLPCTVSLSNQRGKYRFLFIVIGTQSAQKRATMVVTAQRNNNYCSVRISNTTEWVVQDVYNANTYVVQLDVISGSDLKVYEIYGMK